MKTDKAISGLWKKVDESFIRINRSMNNLIPHKALSYIVFAIIIFVLLFTFWLRQAVLIGMVIGPEGIKHTDNIDLNFTGTQEYIWYPANPGVINSISIDGFAQGNGSASVILMIGDQSYLVLNISGEGQEKPCGDCKGKITRLTLQYKGNQTALVKVVQKKDDDVVFESSVEPGSQFSFSGTDKEGVFGTEIIIFVNGVENTNIHTSCSKPIGAGLLSGDFEVISGYSKDGGSLCPIEDEEDKKDKTEKEDEEDGEEQEEEAIPPEDAAISLSFEFADNPEFDPDNDGVEPYDGIIDLTVEGTSFSWGVNESHLCTKWTIENVDDNNLTEVCSGSALCCDFVEAEFAGTEWDSAYYAYPGKDAAAENNTITAQVVYVDYNLSSENLYSYIYYSKTAKKQALFLPISPFTINFSEACVDTCLLPGFNYTNYRFVIQSDPGTTLVLQNISYYLAAEENITMENISEFSRIYEGQDLVKDTYLRNREPDTNYGDDDQIKVGNENAWDRNRRGMLQFNISDIPKNAVIESAELKIYKKTGAHTGDITLYRLVQSWAEDRATWNEYEEGRAWANSGGDYDPRIYASLFAGDGWGTVEITGLVQEWVNETYENYGVILLRDPEDVPNTYGYFMSSEAKKTSERPKLIVNYTLINDTEPPQVILASLIDNMRFVVNSVINITVNISDNYGIDSVFTNISWDGYNEVLELSRISENSTLYNGLFSNTSEPGNYTLNLIVTDVNGLVNDTVTVSFEIIIADYPQIYIISPIENYTYVSGQNSTIRLNVTDTSAIDSVFANISWSYNSQLLELVHIDNSTIYEAVFTNTSYIGDYSINIIANNSYGLINDSLSWMFSVCDNCSLEQPINIIIFNSTEDLNFTINITILEDGSVEMDFPDDPLEVKYTVALPFDPPVVKVIFHGLVINATGPDDLEIGVDYPLDYPDNPFLNLAQLYALDFSKVPHDYTEVFVLARGKSLYKCVTWNFTTRKCDIEGDNWGTHIFGVKDEKQGNGTAGWVKLMDVPQDEEIYTFILYPRDPGFIEDGAAYCSSSPCIATSAMIRSVDNAGGIAEFNQPNTIDNCRDGNKGTYLVDESVENITVIAQNYTVFITEDTVNVNATVHCFGDGSSDNITFVYSNNTKAAPGSWRVIDKVTPCPGSGMQEVSTSFTLDNRSGNHSVRVIIRHEDSADVTCGTGKYDDNDDISFLVYSKIETKPFSNSPPDQDVDIGEETTIEWVLQDNLGAGDYYIERDGQLFAGPEPWANNTKIIIRPNSYFLGSWNYTIYYNNSLGVSGVPDTVLVNVSDKTIPSCDDLVNNSNYPTLKDITIDGDMADWEAVASNNHNYVFDLTEAGGDLDTGMTADRDLVGFAYTWDDLYLYLYYKRLNSGANVINMLAYMDYDNDGYMNATDQVLRFVWSGTNQKYNSDLYDYIPGGTADLILGSGYDMPGSITLNASIEDNIIGGADSGIELEVRVPFSSMGFTGPTPINFQAASSLGTNLPSQLQDNVDSKSSLYAHLLFQPDHSKAAANGTSVYYGHDLMNCGMLEETIDLANMSSQGWQVMLYYPNGTLISDTNANSKPDATLGVDNYTTVIARIDVPGNAQSGAIDTTDITAISSVDPAVNETVTDTTITGEIAITPAVHAISGAPGMLAALNYTIYNLQRSSDTIEINAASSQGWNISLYHSNGSIINDTDGDNHPDIGLLLPGESRDIMLVFMIPDNSTYLTNDITTIHINSSLKPNLTANATSDTTVKMRIIIEPDYARSVGIGDASYYKLTISNNWNESDVIDLARTFIQDWDTSFYGSDKITLLSDTDTDGLVDTGEMGYYGSEQIIYARITVPVTAGDGDTEFTEVFANSSKEPSAYNTSLINTTARIVITYNDFARTTEQFVFEIGGTVYVRAHNLGVNNVYYQWIDPNSTVVRISPDIIVSAEDSADDLLATNISMLLGNWTIIVFNAQNDNEIGRNEFQLVDIVLPDVTLNNPPAGYINDSAAPVSISFNCSAADNYRLVNISLYITDSSNQSFSMYSTSAVSGTSNSSAWDLDLQEGDYTWNCLTQDSSGNLDWGDQNRSIVVEAAAISKVILYTPLNESSDPETMPTFIWYNATSDENLSLVYQLQVDDTPDFSSELEINITKIAEGDNLTNYTMATELEPDTMYYWHVRAYNGTDYGIWSSTWEYYAEGVVAFSFILQNISFGMMGPGEQDNTTDNSPMPFIIQNDGNVFIDISINAGSALWVQQPLNTSYFQFRADDRNEQGAFNLSASQVLWNNISLDNKQVIRQLGYSELNDTSVIDILMKVPIDEPAGTKSSNINFIAEKSKT